MPTRDQYEAVHRQGLKVVLRLVEEAVWQMAGPEDYQRPLTALVDGLRALRIPFHGCGLYLLEPAEDAPKVVCQYAWNGESWNQTTIGEDHYLMVAVWRDGEARYYRDVDAEDPFRQAAGLQRRFGHAIRSALHIPFAHGVLTVVSASRAAFSRRDIDLLKDLAETLPGLFRRMDDLRELESRDRQLEHAQRLELVGQVAASTAHEVNNYLSVITGYCELLLNNKPDSAERTRLETVLTAARHTLAINSRLLDLARGEEGARHPASINDLITEATGLISYQLERAGVELVQDLAPDLPPVPVQALQVQQVLINLVQNSRDAAIDSGRQVRVCVRTKEESGWVLVEVEDDGPGIPLSLRERVFEPFFTTKDKGQGTGLGLSVCRTIAENHGARLYLQEQMHGTCVVLALPVSAATEVAPLRMAN